MKTARCAAEKGAALSGLGNVKTAKSLAAVLPYVYQGGVDLASEMADFHSYWGVYPSAGQTAHNTLLVDEQDTRIATPTGIRHDFAPEVKFLATSASGVFEGV